MIVETPAEARGLVPEALLQPPDTGGSGNGRGHGQRGGHDGREPLGAATSTTATQTAAHRRQSRLQLLLLLAAGDNRWRSLQHVDADSAPELPRTTGAPSPGHFKDSANKF